MFALWCFNSVGYIGDAFDRLFGILVFVSLIGGLVVVVI